MPITGKAIFEGQYIVGGEEANVRDVSYDLSIDRVIRAGKEDSGDILVLNPQEMVILVSRERVRIPKGYVGYAMPKTSLCNRGLLALNTGIIDPGYEGKISSTSINFREKSLQLRRGEPFLRLVFHKMTEPVGTDKNVSDSDYLAARRQDSELYPSTFLNIPQQIEDITNKIVAKETNRLLHILTWVTASIGVFAVVVAIFTLIVPDLRLLLERTTLDEQKNKVEQMSRTISDLSQEVTRLKGLIDNQGKKTSIDQNVGKRPKANP